MKTLAFILSGFLLGSIVPARAQAVIKELQIPIVTPGFIDQVSMTTGNVVPTSDPDVVLPVIYNLGTVFQENGETFIRKLGTESPHFQDHIYRIQNVSELPMGLVGKRVLYNGIQDERNSSIRLTEIKDLSGSFSLPIFWCWAESSSETAVHTIFLLTENVYDQSSKRAYSKVTYWQYLHPKNVVGFDRFSKENLQLGPLEKTVPEFSSVDTDGELAAPGPSPEGGRVQRINGTWSLRFRDEFFSEISCLAAGGKTPDR